MTGFGKYAGASALTFCIYNCKYNTKKYKSFFLSNLNDPRHLKIGHIADLLIDSATLSESFIEGLAIEHTDNIVSFA